MSETSHLEHNLPTTLTFLSQTISKANEKLSSLFQDPTLGTLIGTLKNDVDMVKLATPKDHIPFGLTQALNRISVQCLSLSTTLALHNTSDSKDIATDLKRFALDLESIAVELNESQPKKLRSETTHLQAYLNDTSVKANELEIKINALSEHANETIEQANSLYETAKNDLNERHSQIDKLMGNLSSRVMADDYQTSAAQEKSTADYLRLGSILCMIIVIIILGYTAYKSMETTIHWEQFLAKITIALLISVPAGYLARESTKHRAQQYAHHQTSLDLRAITPFLASLPEDQQHKIKAEIAYKIFTGSSSSNGNIETFTLNSQELLLEIIKKLDLPKTKN